MIFCVLLAAVVVFVPFADNTALILTLCGCGFAFCLTGVVIACRRLLSSFRSS